MSSYPKYCINCPNCFHYPNGPPTEDIIHLPNHPPHYPPHHPPHHPPHYPPQHVPPHVDPPFHPHDPMNPYCPCSYCQGHSGIAPATYKKPT
uniref:Uncharacterized protein n=1 Tax=Phlebotomus papatasi TaxID=29031 RepID=A0A1B0DPK3_PHLPP